jgi:putative ABC transport system ATP-binding protein
VPPSPVPVVELRDARRLYPRGTKAVAALDGVSLAVAQGEKVAIMGPSGSGKSTLLSILGCLDRPTSGEYLLDGEPVSSLDDDRLSHTRNRHIGFVFQSFHLLPHLTVAENVETPLLYGPVPPHEWRPRALAGLARVGLAERADHRPSELSGGEAQRTAIARALVTEPRLLLADEPTGNLDSVTGDEIARLLDSLHAEGRTIILVTHNEALARQAERMVRLRDGRVESDERFS